MFSTNSDQRSKARDTCRSLGADLVKITSAEENNRIVGLAPAKGIFQTGILTSNNQSYGALLTCFLSIFSCEIPFVLRYQT